MKFNVSTPAPAAPNYGVGGVTLGAAAATPSFRTVLMVINGDANTSLIIEKMSVTFDGVTASNTPALVQVAKCSMATAGNPGQPATISQHRGPGNTSGAGLTPKFSANAGYAIEPTVFTQVLPVLTPPTSGYIDPDALGDELEIIPGSGTMGIAIRVMNLQAVNCHAWMRVAQGVT